MANSDTATGLSPVQYLNGAPYNGQTNTYQIAAAEASGNIHVGDAVSLAGGLDATGRYQLVTKGAINGVFVGVITAVEMETADSLPYRAALTLRNVHVADDPNIVFEIQEDGDTTPIAVANGTKNASLILGTGSTTTGLSGWEIDSTTVAATATLDLLLLRLADRPDNEVGAYAKWLVRLNNHQYVDGSLGV